MSARVVSRRPLPAINIPNPSRDSKDHHHSWLLHCVMRMKRMRQEESRDCVATRAEKHAWARLDSKKTNQLLKALQSVLPTPSAWEPRLSACQQDRLTYHSFRNINPR